MQGGAGLIPGQGTKIPHAPGSRNESVKQKQYCSKFNEDFKNGPHRKKKKSLMYRTVLWTLWERERVGRFGRMALKHVKYHV